MLKETINKKITALNICLNPYFNGTCSKRRFGASVYKMAPNSLNPYFNGTCSKR